MMISRLFLTFIVLNLCRLSQEKIFTALAHLEPLLDTHKRIIADVTDYVTNNVHSHHNNLRSYLDIFREEQEKAVGNVTNYISNPLNAFTLIKQMNVDIVFIDDYLRNDPYKEILITKYRDAIYPSAEDMVGAAKSIARLQQTYQLKVADLAKGIINGVTNSSKMRASARYELGKALYNEKDFNNALAWLRAALRKFNKERNVLSLNRIDIFAYISLTQYSLGNFTEALKWCNMILEIDETNDWATENAGHFKKKIEKEETKAQDDEISKKIDLQNESHYPYRSIEEKKVFEALCRGKQKIPTQISKRLKCRYLSETHPFLRLAPIKMEYKYLNPDIVMLYDVLSDQEIEELKELAKPRLTPEVGLVFVRDPLSYFVKNTGILQDEESPAVKRVSRRAADVTGLNLTTAEYLQVANYGIGGHHVPHYDFVTNEFDEDFPKTLGNRIATVLFYMSDVALGGATVFTELGLSLMPVRGAAVMWFNLLPSGEGNKATRHAGCPVLLGDKWVSSKYFHQVGQELIKPCEGKVQKQKPTKPIVQPTSVCAVYPSHLLEDK